MNDKKPTKKEETKNRIKDIETKMLKPDFWQNSSQAQNLIKEMQDLKDEIDGVGKFDKGNVILTIFAGVGGDDAEDFVRMLLEMYMKFSQSKKWQINFLDESANTESGYKTITIEIVGRNAYANLKNESGVHRLVRKSPFNSAGKRQTSFAMVEVLPVLKNQTDKNSFKVPEDELDISFTKASGPGGQNVNKRETAVRIVHTPTKLSAFVSNERSQAQNREKAMEIIYGKIYNLKQEEQKAKENAESVSSNTEAKWGSQIRSYVLHPYKMVKDHRTNYESSDVDSVLNGRIEEFIQSLNEQS
jgi:peptide chain release factor 2